MMHLVPLDSAIAGMQLGCALVDENGNVLLPEGCILTLAISNALHLRAIAAVTITDITITMASPSDEDIAARIDHVFRRGGSNANLMLQSAILCLRLAEAS